MTHVLAKPTHAASPWMLALSVGLHGLVILMAVVVSLTVARRVNPTDEVISRVKLVEAPAGEARVEQIQAGPSKLAPPVAREELEQTSVAAEVPEPVREAIHATASRLPKKEIIPLTKRKRPLQRVEAPKKPEKKKEAEPPKKQESPESLLEKAKASIRDRVESRKSHVSAAPTDAVSGSKSGGGVIDEELVRWLEGVRDRINSHWSIFGDQRKLQRVTVIGVKVAENGRLLEASVNTSSGDEVFDTSALRAVFQADPFPRVPAEVMERIRKAGGLALRFTPGGMQ